MGGVEFERVRIISPAHNLLVSLRVVFGRLQNHPAQQTMKTNDHVWGRTGILFLSGRGGVGCGGGWAPAIASVQDGCGMFPLCPHPW